MKPLSENVWFILSMGLLGLFLLFGAPFLIYFKLAQPVRISGQAMSPSYNPGELWMVRKTNVSVQRGDVIMFRYPLNPSFDYINRVVAIPGDEIKLNNRVVYINNEQIASNVLSGKFLDEGQTLTVPAESYFVLGDNVQHSSDSREWGFVPKVNIKGVFWFRYH